MNESENITSFEDFLRGISPSAFKALGLNQLAYIKAGNDNSFELHAADGQVLAKFKTFEHALTATQDQDLKAVTVH
ncbi:MAG: hypothetical protein ACPG05_01400 [Bdellovibrionales bacterium]